MATREWLMSERNLADEPIESLGDMSERERANLALLVRQCRGWSSQNIDEVVAVMAEDGVYHDITLPPAVGHDAIREFGAGWLDAVPDLSLHIEAFCVQGNIVCDMGWMSGTITKDYFGLPGTASASTASSPRSASSRTARSSICAASGTRPTCTIRWAGIWPASSASAGRRVERGA